MTLDPSMLASFIEPFHSIIIIILIFAGMALKKSGNFKDGFIPVGLAAISLILCFLYTLSKGALPSASNEICKLILNTIVQAFVCVAGAVYVNQVGKQMIKMKQDEEQKQIKKNESGDE